MIEKLVGEIIVEITGAEKESDQVVIKTRSGKTFTLYHGQNCCEHVRLIDIVGDAQELIGNVVSKAEKVENEAYAQDEDPKCDEYCQWTFYHINAGLTYVTLRWLGETNSMYSLDVTCDVEYSNNLLV